MSDVENPSQILEATEGFAARDPSTGENVIVQAGFTRLAADHWLARTFPGRFQPVADHLTYETEEMTDEPGRRRNRVSRQDRPAPPAALRKHTEREAVAAAGKESDS